MAKDDGHSPLIEQGTASQEVTGLLGQLTVAVGHLREAVTGAGGQPVIPWEAAHPVPILGQIPLAAGAGTLDQPDMYGPKDPYWWDLRRLAVWGFTAGTVTVYLNSTSGEQIAQATTVGEFTWSAQHLLSPRDRLLFGATGMTGSVFVAGQAIEVATAWLPAYLM